MLYFYIEFFAVTLQGISYILSEMSSLSRNFQMKHTREVRSRSPEDEDRANFRSCSRVTSMLTLSSLYRYLKARRRGACHPSK